MRNFQHSTSMDRRRSALQREQFNPRPDTPSTILAAIVAAAWGWTKIFHGKRTNRGKGAGGQIVGSSRIPRNQPCPCGSGWKYKLCCNLKGK